MYKSIIRDIILGYMLTTSCKAQSRRPENFNQILSGNQNHQFSYQNPQPGNQNLQPGNQNPQPGNQNPQPGNQSSTEIIPIDYSLPSTSKGIIPNRKKPISKKILGSRKLEKPRSDPSSSHDNDAKDKPLIPLPVALINKGHSVNDALNILDEIISYSNSRFIGEIRKRTVADSDLFKSIMFTDNAYDIRNHRQNEFPMYALVVVPASNELSTSNFISNYLLNVGAFRRITFHSCSDAFSKGSPRWIFNVNEKNNLIGRHVDDDEIYEFGVMAITSRVVPRKLFVATYRPTKFVLKMYNGIVILTADGVNHHYFCTENRYKFYLHIAPTSKLCYKGYILLSKIPKKSSS